MWILSYDSVVQPPHIADGLFAQKPKWGIIFPICTICDHVAGSGEDERANNEPFEYAGMPRKMILDQPATHDSPPAPPLFTRRRVLE